MSKKTWTVNCPKCGAIIAFTHNDTNSTIYRQCPTSYCGSRAIQIRNGVPVKVSK